MLTNFVISHIFAAFPTLPDSLSTGIHSIHSQPTTLEMLGPTRVTATLANSTHQWWCWSLPLPQQRRSTHCLHPFFHWCCSPSIRRPQRFRGWPAICARVCLSICRGDSRAESPFVAPFAAQRRPIEKPASSLQGQPRIDLLLSTDFERPKSSQCTVL